MSKKSYIIIGVIVVGIFLIYSSIKGTFNSMNRGEQGVKSQWAKVESQYQRRSDLIPNLVSVVKGYADHEKSTLEAVINARAKATSTTIDPSNLDAASIQKFQAAQSELSSSLSRLLVSVERYPDLKANKNFSELQAQLEGTENRIAVERNRFNDAVNAYNILVTDFPGRIYAGIFGFKEKGYFQSDAGAEKAPKVEF
ncbi:MULTISPECIES: LemA family protein [Reichenbachiella]|uniref:LemA family protein n=1 Tax=Reichenbachiella TaxID=156993 RepID=UPI000C156C2B|nr:MULTISPECIES: LemA family protein [Reichenbachiella]MBU2914546.1 LemA family protein [Reichenbachiella agariperforans]PIB34213.1 LemA family protein [Reichenbachiella sp. 5M10]RJE73963.1 LemA family protein [Reichenbachiella sp. MSK19-1]